MIKLLFLSGSTRQQSFNKKLALLAAKYCQRNTDVNATFMGYGKHWNEKLQLAQTRSNASA